MICLAPPREVKNKRIRQYKLAAKSQIFQITAFFTKPCPLKIKIMAKQ